MTDGNSTVTRYLVLPDADAELKFLFAALGDRVRNACPTPTP